MLLLNSNTLTYLIVQTCNTKRCLNTKILPIDRSKYNHLNCYNTNRCSHYHIIHLSVDVPIIVTPTATERVTTTIRTIFAVITTMTTIAAVTSTTTITATAAATERSTTIRTIYVATNRLRQQQQQLLFLFPYF